MIYYKNNKWHIANEEITYTRDGEVFTQAIGQEGKQWWLDFEEKWEHTEIIEFIEVEPTEEQVKRFEEILLLDLPDGYSGELSEYVEHGMFPEGFNHVLRDLQPKKELEKAKQEIAFNNAMSNLENLQLIESIRADLEVAQAEANYELMMLVMTMGGN